MSWAGDGALERVLAGQGFYLADLPALDAWPADALAELLAAESGVAAVDLAYLLARRHDSRGVAGLARLATEVMTAQRALAAVAELGLEEMLPAAYRVEPWRDLAAATHLVGEPIGLHGLYRDTAPWSAPRDLRAVVLYRYRRESGGTGLLLLQPVVVHYDLPAAGLDTVDALDLVRGRVFEPAPDAVDAEAVGRRPMAELVKRQAWRYPSQLELAAAWQTGEGLVLVVRARCLRRMGYIVGGAGLPVRWLPLAEAGEGLTPLDAFYLWAGRNRRQPMPGR